MTGALPRKYAPWLTLLRADPAYLRRAPAPAYWALSPYHVGQFNDCACSLASAAMLVNAARGSAGLAAGEPLVAQQALLAAVDSPVWHAGVGSNDGHGVSLAQIGPLVAAAFAASGLPPPTLEAVPVADETAAAAARFRAALTEIETLPGRMLLLNFFAATVYGTGEYGHFSPAGAYDAALDRVLVLDVDRAWYEPYWVPAPVLLAAMNSTSPIDGERRGYLRIAPG